LASTAKFNPTTPIRRHCAFRPHGVILSGSPESTTVADGPRAPGRILELKTPLLGICYGMQTMAVQLGGRVESSDHREFGYAQVRAHAHSTLLRDIEDHASPEGYGLLDVWMSHGDQVIGIAARFHPHRQHRDLPDRRHGRRGSTLVRGAVSSRSDAHPPGRAHSAPFRAGHLRLRAVVDHRQHHRGQHRRRPCPGGWRRGAAGLSGGVDSSVVAALLHRAIGAS
jgi:GMP synthase (glutamine-hydrolysing)